MFALSTCLPQDLLFLLAASDLLLVYKPSRTLRSSSCVVVPITFFYSVVALALFDRALNEVKMELLCCCWK